MNIEPLLSQQPWTHEHLVHERAIALSHAIDRSTKSTYNSATNSYLTFCHLHHRPVDPTPETLSFFTVFMCHHINPKSVNNYLSGICNNLEGHFPDVRSTRNSPLVSRTLAGCKRLYGRPTLTGTHKKCILINWAPAGRRTYRCLAVRGELLLA
jgi:hypothetical protein